MPLPPQFQKKPGATAGKPFPASKKGAKGKGKPPSGGRSMSKGRC